MNSLAFLIFLGGFSYVVWWYIRNVEMKQDGEHGLLAFKTEEDDQTAMEARLTRNHDALPENLQKAKEEIARKAAADKPQVKRNITANKK